MKKVLLTLITSLTAFGAISQPSDAPSVSVLNDPYLPVYVIAVAMLVLLVVVAVVAIHAIRVLNFLTRQVAEQKTARSEAPQLSGDGWWKRFIDRMNASVPVEQEKDIEMDHSYDGIRELDNHLPPWWKWLFYGSMVFALAYMIIYHVTDTLPLSLDEYKHEVALAEQQVRKYQASQPQAAIDENTIEFTGDPALIERGKAVFVSNNCGGCHRNDGGGNTIGPNLSDEYWLHGGAISNIFQTIKNGVVEKGMPAWGKSMTAQDIRDVTFFIMSLQGTNPPDAKPPQGELFRQVKASVDSVNTQAGL